ncbi:MAG TPA: response regulator [Terriglobales bacterium]|nr:response regulator [Terriglobales bacterium]
MNDRKNLLVIDDEPIVLDSCRRILKQEGFDVNGAFSGREGLKKIEEDKYDAVLVDWKLPEIDGMEVLRIIKKNHPEVVVVMITGYPSVESAVKAMKLGVSDYVSKPFSPDELKDTIIKAIESSRTAKKEGKEAETVVDTWTKRMIAGTEDSWETEVKEAKPTGDTVLVTPVEVPFPEAGGKVGLKKSFLATLWSRLFFIALGPVVLFSIFIGIFKVVFSKKLLEV